MPAVQACVLAFQPRSGTGSQTVTGVVDADGNAFTGKVFLFQSGFTAANTLTGGGSPGTGGYASFRGVDAITRRSTFGCCDAWSPFNFKAVSSFQSLGDYSLISAFTANFGDTFFERLASISAVRSGEFDILYAQNDRTGDTVFVLVFGGDDLDLDFTDTTNGTYTTTSKPQGLLALPTPNPSGGGGTAGGAGGQDVSWGFATRDGDYGASNLSVVNQGTNFAYQRTTAFSNAIVGALPTVSAWTDTSFTIANGPSASIPLVFCGETVLTAGGAITQPLATGDQVIDVGMSAKAVIFLSTGQIASDTSISPSGQQVTGWATPAAQVGYWTGERTNGNVNPVYGARYASNSAVIRFGSPEGLSTTFGSIAAVSDIDGESGTVTLTWSAVDGVERQVLWFVIGEAIAPPVPPPEPIFHTREVVRRRLRRAPIVWSEKDGLQTRVRINLFAVDMQPGVGTRDTPDPLVMIRASKDGGFTWGNERLVSAGRVGEYFDRLNSWQWGHGRDWVFEVACADPVTWNLIGAYLDAEGGTS